MICKKWGTVLNLEKSGIKRLSEPIKKGFVNDIGKLIGEFCKSFIPDDEVVVFS